MGITVPELGVGDETVTQGKPSLPGRSRTVALVLFFFFFCGRGGFGVGWCLVSRLLLGLRLQVLLSCSVGHVTRLRLQQQELAVVS